MSDHLCFFCTMVDGSSRPEGHDGPHGAEDFRANLEAARVERDDQLNGAMRIETLDDLRAAVQRMDAAGTPGQTRVQVLIQSTDFAESEGDDEMRATYCAAIDAAGAFADENPAIMIWPSNPLVRSR